MGFRPVHVSLRSRIQSAHGRAQRLGRALADATPEPRPGDIYVLPPRGEVHLTKLVVLRAADTGDGWWVMAADEDPLSRNDDVDLSLIPDATHSLTEPMTLRGDRVLCVAPHVLASERRVGRLSRAELARALTLRRDPPEVTDTDLAATLASVDRQLGLWMR